jgi:hypothetical protein
MVGPVGDFSRLHGRVVVDRDGSVIGRVEGVYRGQMADRTEWCVIAGAGSEPEHRLLPLAECRLEAGQINIPYTEAVISSSPLLDPTQNPSPDQEEQLFRFYSSIKGWGPGEEPVGPESSTRRRPAGWGPAEDPTGPEKE